MDLVCWETCKGFGSFFTHVIKMTTSQQPAELTRGKICFKILHAGGQWVKLLLTTAPSLVGVQVPGPGIFCCSSFLQDVQSMAHILGLLAGVCCLAHTWSFPLLGGVGVGRELLQEDFSFTLPFR